MNAQAVVIADPVEYWLWQIGWLIPMELVAGIIFLCWFVFIAVSIMRDRRRFEDRRQLIGKRSDL
ncbi:hypothetical protein [Komagataeibacter europaeus]|uniref:hypothetical protein n=1 Tax=Komagataeibacter europaeus TaxID=33995 RepID=UPI000237DECE|nr:hypothetical protein [Komagataeibacter europaeus]